jgi:hypothetical protein
MKEYEVEVCETLIRIVTVKALTAEDAVNLVNNIYMGNVAGEEIVLDSDDFFDVDFNVVNNDTTIK